MSDIERRLRAAMNAVAEQLSAEQLSAGRSGEHWPAGLLADIRRRHRRHVKRAGAGFAAALVVVAAAVPSLAHALSPAPGPAAQAPMTPASGVVPYLGRSPAPATPAVPATKPSAHPASTVPATAPAKTQATAPGTGPASGAAPGTVLRDCGSENYSDLSGSNWRAQSVRAGPLWFYEARQKGNWPASRQLSHGQIQAVGVPVVVQAGAKVVVRVAAAAQSRFRFLSGFNGTNRYSLTDGKPGVTFIGCPASDLGPLTIFWVGYLNDGLSCVPFEVQTPASKQPVDIALSTGGGTCKP